MELRSLAIASGTRETTSPNSVNEPILTFGYLAELLNSSPSVISDNLEFRIEDKAGEAGPGALVSSLPAFRVRIYERGTYNATNQIGQPYVSNGDEDGMLHLEPTTTDPTLNPGQYIRAAGPAPTQGICGFVDGTYQIDIYSVYYRTINQHMGRLQVHDL